jgi:glycosyltransferase involved in cell wall biosynthesis
LAALEAKGRLGPTFDSSAYAGPRVKLWIDRMSRVYYGSRFETMRGRFERDLRARRSSAFFARLGVHDVLHMGSADLPLPRVLDRGGTRHYIYCDATWDLWRRGSSDANQYAPRLAADADRLERRAYHQLAHIFTTGEHVRDNLVAHYGVPSARVTVVGTGRGAIRPYDGPKDYADRLILFVAKERPADKGGVLLIEGFRRAVARDARLKLLMIGDQSLREHTDGVPNVEMRGFVPLEELQDAFERASLFAMPAAHEPWGLAYLEALSCRAPVLGLKRNALPELTGQGRFGVCLDDATPDGVAAALADAFADTGRLARMGAEGQAFVVERFTWEATVDRILERIDAP